METEVPNLDVYQLEKTGQIILSDKEFRGNKKIAGVIAALAVGLVITIGVVRDRRHWKSRQQRYGR